MAWDSNQYLKFAEERKRPCLDLLARLPGPYVRILDLGCGPGNSTADLQARFPAARITGFDSDANMLDRARADHPDLDFVQGLAPADLGKLPGQFDLVFSNACIHWIPDQEALIASLAGLLAAGGMIAVQLPLTDHAPFYKLLYRLVDQKWPQLAGIRNFHNLDAIGYYNALSRYFTHISIWQTDYYHVIDGRSGVLEWYKGSGLRPYLAALDESDRAAFLHDLTDCIEKDYALLDDGRLFLIMPRLFFIAQK